jgi:xanthine dehydrogenase accessory factor
VKEGSVTVHVDVMEVASRLRAAEQPFVLATVVRTISVTAAKAGAKAVIRPDGTIEAGWIGGGCARAAVIKAAGAAFADGNSRLVSIQPQDLLAEHGVAAGDERDGIRYASNMCPSQGTMDIFVEPVLPRTELVVLGSSPVAAALAELGQQFGLRIVVDAQTQDASKLARRFVVVATQGRGDEAALRAALAIPAEYRAFVGSRRKMASLRERLAGLEGLDDIRAPAGLDLGAITPEEIALSILAEITMLRRKGQRDPDDGIAKPGPRP